MADTARPVHYFSIQEAIEIHILVMEFGNSPQSRQPLRLGGENILGSALARPRQAAFYEEANVIRQASLLCIGVSQAQAFADVNKRTAFALAEIFLNNADFTIAGNGEGVAIRLIEVAAGLSRDSSAQHRAELESEFEAFLGASLEPLVEESKSEDENSLKSLRRKGQSGRSRRRL